MAVEAAGRASEQRLRLGNEIRAMRERRWTRARLASRAGLGRMVVSRLERGLTNVDLDALQRIGLAMGRPLVVTFGRDVLEQPADAGHLLVQELVLRIGRAAGYDVNVELPTRPAEAWRSADVCLARTRDHRHVLVECWNTIGDVGAAIRSTDRKRSDLQRLAIARWGDDSGIGVVWVVRASARNRAIVGRYPEVFRARFPASSRDWVRALTTGAVPPAGDGLIWCDVGATRLFEWRR